jgi:hypothetical protein
VLPVCVFDTAERRGLHHAATVTGGAHRRPCTPAPSTHNQSLPRAHTHTHTHTHTQLEARRWQCKELQAALGSHETALADKEVQLAHLAMETQRLGALLQRKQVRGVCVCVLGGVSRARVSVCTHTHTHMLVWVGGGGGCAGGVAGMHSAMCRVCNLTRVRRLCVEEPTAGRGVCAHAAGLHPARTRAGAARGVHGPRGGGLHARL